MLSYLYKIYVRFDSTIFGKALDSKTWEISSLKLCYILLVDFITN